MSAEIPKINQAEIIPPLRPNEVRNVNEWIAENPQRAIDLAQKVLSPRRASFFSEYISSYVSDTRTVEELAESQGVTKSVFQTVIRKSKKQIAYYVGVVPASEKSHKLFSASRAMSRRNKELEEGFLQAKEGNPEGIPMILNSIKTLIDNRTQKMGEIEAEAFRKSVTRRIERAVSQIEWRDKDSFNHYLTRLFSFASMDVKRKMKALEKPPVEKRVIPPPIDLLSQWGQDNPEMMEALLATLPHKHASAVRFDLDGKITRNEIESILGIKRNSLKVIISKTKAELVKKANIKVPDGYEPLSNFLDRQNAQQLNNRSNRGEFGQVLRLNGVKYFSREGVDAYLAKTQKDENVILEDVPLKIKRKGEVLSLLYMAEDVKSAIEDAKSGQEQALEKIFDDILDPLYRYSYASLNSRLGTEVFLTNAMEVIGRRIVTDEIKEPFHIWLFKTCEGIMAKFKSTNQQRVDEVGNLGPLSPLQRSIYALRFGANLGYQDVAKVLGKPYANVYKMGLETVSILNSEKARS